MIAPVSTAPLVARALADDQANRARRRASSAGTLAAITAPPKSTKAPATAPPVPVPAKR